jgi:hypothetical protein
MESPERNPVADGDRDFWQPGPELEEFSAQPFAADDPEALPRRLGPLPDDPEGTATAELRRLYAVLADEAEAEALSQ